MSTLQTADYTGSCLCGGVAYEINGELSPVDYYMIANGLPQHAGEPDSSR